MFLFNLFACNACCLVQVLFFRLLNQLSIPRFPSLDLRYIGGIKWPDHKVRISDLSTIFWIILADKTPSTNDILKASDLSPSQIRDGRTDRQTMQMGGLFQIYYLPIKSFMVDNEKLFANQPDFYKAA